MQSNKQETEEDRWRYNCEDCVRTREVGEVSAANIEKMGLQAVDAFQQKLFWPVLFAMQRGVKIDQKRRAAMATTLMEEMAAREEWFRYVLGHPLNPGSNVQMVKLFYEDLKQMKNFAKVKKGMFPSLTVDAEAMAKIGLREPILRPLLKKIEEYRSLGVFLRTFVLAPLDVDERMRCSYNICGTETYRFSSSKNAFDSGCFPAETAEVLTRQGWVPIESIRSGEQIAAYNRANLVWEPAEPYVVEFNGTLVSAKTEQYAALVTPGHRLLATKAGREEWRDYHAGDMAEFSSLYTIPVGASLLGGTIRFTAERLFVAALADGSYDGTQVRFSFKKTRKSKRLIELCDLYDIELHETHTSREGYRRFWFRRPEDWPEKRWDWWVCELAPIAAVEMLQECRYWDATDRGSSFWFFSSKRMEAECVQTLAHIAGFGATLRVVEQNPGSYSTTTMYVVNVKPRSTVGVEGKHWSRKSYTGKVYCVTVPSQYFLVRQCGFISITGNTNLQNLPKGGDDDDSDLVLPNVRSIFIPDPGFTFFDTDLSKADLRIVTWESDEREMKAMLAEGRDPYVEAAQEFYHDRTIRKTRDDGTEHPKYRTFKSFAHGTHYLGTPFGLARRLALTVAEVERTQKWYFGRFPRIQQWQKEFKAQLRARRYVENIFGYRRYYFDRIDEATEREAIAWLPQSTVAILVNKIWMNIWEGHRWIQVLLQVHDSLGGQFPTYRKTEALTTLKEAAKIVLPYPEPLTIPVGIACSETSWGDCR